MVSSTDLPTTAVSSRCKALLKNYLHGASLTLPLAGRAAAACSDPGEDLQPNHAGPQKSACSHAEYQPSSSWDVRDLNIWYGKSSAFEKPCPGPSKLLNKKMLVANIHRDFTACLSLTQ